MLVWAASFRDAGADEASDGSSGRTLCRTHRHVYVEYSHRSGDGDDAAADHA